MFILHSASAFCFALTMAGAVWADEVPGAENPTKDALATDAGGDDPNALILQIVAATEDAATQTAMLSGMLQGLQNQRGVKPPAQWATLYPKLAASPSVSVRRVALKLAHVFGDSRAHRELVKTVQNVKAPVKERREAIELLVDNAPGALKPVLRDLLDDPALRHDAIRAYLRVEDASAPRWLLDRYKKLSADERRTAIEVLAARRAYYDAFLKALRSGKIPKRDVPVYVVRSLQRSLGQAFTDVWGDVKVVSADKVKQTERYNKLLTDANVAAGNVANGRVIFGRTCAACHKLYDGGGDVGPDITGSNRANLDYILYQIIDPNHDVPEAYRMTLVTTVDGLLISGRVEKEDAQSVTLQTTDGRKAILKSEIDERQLSPNSMMPEGLLKTLKDDDARDLILYLRSKTQVPLPK